MHADPAPRSFAPEPRWRRAEFAVIASLALFVVMVTAAAAWFGIDAVWARVRAVPLGVIAAMLALAATNYALRGWRWHLFAEQLGVRVPFKRNVLYYFAGFAMTTTPGKVGEVLRLWLLERGHGALYTRTSAMFVGDRASDLAGVLFWCVVGVVLYSGYDVAVWLFVALVAAGFAALRYPALLRWGLNAAYRLVGRAGRLFARLRHALDATAGLLGSWTFTLTALLSIVAWFTEACTLYIVLVALDVEIGLFAAVFIFCFAMLVGAAAMLPGGLGGTEASMSGLLIAFDVPPETAVAATLLTRLTTLWFAVAIGAVLLPLALRVVRRTPEAPAPAPNAPPTPLSSDPVR